LDLEGVLGVIALALCWRIVLAIAAAAGLAFLIAPYSWTSPLQLLVLVALGGFIGAAFDDAARQVRASREPPERQTSAGVAALAAGLAGAGWGSVSAASVGTAMFGGVMLIVALLTWAAWYRRSCAGKASPRLAVVGSSSAIGYVTSIALWWVLGDAP